MTGEGFKALRQLMNLTQDQMGSLLGVHGRSVSKWERLPEGPPLPITKAMDRLVFIHEIAELFQPTEINRYRLRARTLMMASERKPRGGNRHGLDRTV